MKRPFACLALVTLFVLSFPALFVQESRNITGTSSVAYAGRTHPMGRWCECGTQDCICDPGEEPCTTCPNQGLTAPRSAEPEPAAVDTGAGLTLIATAVLLLLRLKRII